MGKDKFKKIYICKKSLTCSNWTRIAMIVFRNWIFQLDLLMTVLVGIEYLPKWCNTWDCLHLMGCLFYCNTWESIQRKKSKTISFDKYHISGPGRSGRVQIGIIRWSCWLSRQTFGWRWYRAQVRGCRTMAFFSAAPICEHRCARACYFHLKLKTSKLAKQ